MSTCCLECGSEWGDGAGVRPGSDCPECGATVHPLPGTDLEPKREPPEELWLPREDSEGGCYHIEKCNVHLLEPVPLDEAVERIREEGLGPCGACEEHHGLNFHVGSGQ